MTPPVFPFQRRAKIGILGGGQLGRMLAEAAHDFGLQTVVYCQNPNEPAAQIATQVIVGAWTDESAVEQFATSGIRWVVGEWENVEPAVVEQIAPHVQVHTMADVLRTGRSRRAEKHLANSLGIPTTRWASFDTLGNAGTLFDAIDLSGWPDNLIAKIDNGGYDGKGQWSFAGTSKLCKHDWKREEAVEFIVEARVDLDHECSVLVERNAAGSVRSSPAVRNQHTNRHGGGILEYSRWDETIMLRHGNQACEYAEKIADALKLVGVICVEFFAAKDGELLFNEFAPRVHNSFHGSIEATGFSQFHRHIAAVTGLDLPDMSFAHPWVMVNLIGNQILQLPELAQLGWSVHDYGKTTIKDGRKMGHATIILDNGDSVETAIQAAKELGLVE